MTREELAAVLTGLRSLQYEIETHGEPPAQFAEISTDCGDLTPLAADPSHWNDGSGLRNSFT